ncbi:hypothetical protein TeGR_g15267 [Tetraparma gracilis]|uniref:Helix-hairpin-helix DNA-binding motif class 1 domain-containing protein n=1 Tax=Tetraparma gracilis TaxID=2962635 RepID=A0ABQ6MMM2_9STRA|nr:hypothetical protein TeGR_g15267 [Tetraparma gracilis]
MVRLHLFSSSVPPCAPPFSSSLSPATLAPSLAPSLAASLAGGPCALLLSCCVSSTSPRAQGLLGCTPALLAQLLDGLPRQRVAYQVQELHTGHLLDVLDASRGGPEPRTVFSDADDLKVRGASLGSVALPDSTSAACESPDFRASFEAAFRRRSLSKSGEARSHVITVLTLASGASLTVIEVYEPPSTSASYTTSIHQYETSSLQRSAFSLSRCLNVTLTNKQRNQSQIVPWREEKLAKIALALASTTDMHVVLPAGADAERVAKGWAAVKRIKAAAAPAAKRPLPSAASSVAAPASKRPRAAAAAASSSSVFSALTPKSGTAARDLIKVARGREQAGRLDSAVKHYKSASSKYLPSYPKLEAKIRRLEDKIGSSDDVAIDSIMGSPPLRVKPGQEETAEAAQSPPPVVSNAAVAKTPFSSIMGSPPLRVKPVEVDEEEAAPVSAKLASTPLKGKPERVVAAEEEEEEEEVEESPVSAKLASTPLKGKPERVVAAEEEEEEEAEEAPVSAKLASTPLKGKPERVVAAEEEEEEEEEEVEEAPVSAKLVSTPLKGLPERVASAAEEEEEVEEAPVSAKLASTPLKGLPERVAPTAAEEEEAEVAQASGKLASTPLKGKPERVIEEPEVPSPAAASAPASKLASTPLKGAASRVLPAEDDASDSPAAPVLDPAPVGTKLASTPIRGTPARVPVAAQEQEGEVAAGTPRRKSLLVSTPLRGTAKKVTHMENLLSYTDTLIADGDDFSKPPTPPPAAPAPTPVRSPLAVKTVRTTPQVAKSPVAKTPACSPKMDLVAILNSGSIEQLMDLEGIGQKRAEKIVAEREKGEFEAASDLTRVGMPKKGIMKLIASQHGGAENVAPATAAGKVVAEETAGGRTRRSTRAA